MLICSTGVSTTILVSYHYRSTVTEVFIDWPAEATRASLFLIGCMHDNIPKFVLEGAGLSVYRKTSMQSIKQSTKPITGRKITVWLLRQCGLPREIAEKIYSHRYDDYEAALWKLMSKHHVVSAAHTALWERIDDEDCDSRLFSLMNPGDPRVSDDDDYPHQLQAVVESHLFRPMLYSHVMHARDNEDSTSWEMLDPHRKAYYHPTHGFARDPHWAFDIMTHNMTHYDDYTVDEYLGLSYIRRYAPYNDPASIDHYQSAEQVYPSTRICNMVTTLHNRSLETEKRLATQHEVYKAVRASVDFMRSAMGFLDKVAQEDKEYACDLLIRAATGEITDAIAAELTRVYARANN